MQTEQIEKVLKLAPIVFAAANILAYINLSIYYWFFDVNIVNYIDIGEILTLFLDKAILILICLFALIGVFLTMIESLLKQWRKERENVDASILKELWEKREKRNNTFF